MKRLLKVLFMSAVVMLLTASMAHTQESVGELDQENNPAEWEASWWGVDSCLGAGQSFTAGKTGLFNAADLLLMRDDAVTEPLRVSMWLANPKGMPSGQALASTSVLPESVVTSGGSWVNIAFDHTAYVVAGRQYVLTLESAQICVGDRVYLWAVEYNTYSGGTTLLKDEDNNEAWTVNDRSDQLFKTYVVPSSLESVSPTGTVMINGGASFTTKRVVTLTLDATDPTPASGVAEMRIRNSDGAWSAWQPYRTTKRSKLSAAAGKKTVYVQYRDAAGNVSARVSDSIKYRP